MRTVEIWRPISGYEGYYEVSNEGRIRSLGRTTNQNNHGGETTAHYKGKVLTGRADSRGYKTVHISKNGTARRLLVHRVVAEAFCNKPDGCEMVNHIDNDPSNNRANNLEWTTPKGNMQWATKQGRMHYRPENLKKAQDAKKKPVVAIDSFGNEYYLPSQKVAAESLGIKTSRGHIAACCRNDYGYKTAGGYRWRYA